MIEPTDREGRALALLRSANPVQVEEVRAELGEEELILARERVLAMLADGRVAPAWRASGAGGRRRLLPRGRRTTAAVVVGVLLLAAAAAAAATGILPVGSVIPGEGFDDGAGGVE
jgi:hypothetical protein